MRLRLLPVLMFALAGMMTVKVGSVWNALRGFGRHRDAGPRRAGAPAPRRGEAKPAEQPSRSQPTPAVAGEQAAAAAARADAGAAPAEAAGQQAATTPEAPAVGHPITEQPMSEEDAAAAAAADAAPEPEVHDPFDYTDEEVDVLQQLAKRREELDLRARQLDEREALIQAAEQRMDQKMARAEGAAGDRRGPAEEAQRAGRGRAEEPGQDVREHEAQGGRQSLRGDGHGRAAGRRRRG